MKKNTPTKKRAEHNPKPPKKFTEYTPTATTHTKTRKPHNPSPKKKNYGYDQ